MLKRTRGKILFADDDDSVLRPTSEALRTAGFVVDTALDSKQAQSALASAAYDAILVDINMPGNQHLELVYKLSEAQALVPIVILTGYPSLETAVAALRLGVVDYVTKPPDLEELFERLDRAVQRGRTLQTIGDTEERVAYLSNWLRALKAGVRDGVPSSGRARLLTAGNDRSAASSAFDSDDDPLRYMSEFELRRLSPRERDVLRELARGHPAQQIARILGLSTNTVRNHLKSVFVKLRVNSQVALLSKLRRSDRGSEGWGAG